MFITARHEDYSIIQKLHVFLYIYVLFYKTDEVFMVRPFHIHTETEPKPNRKIKMP